MNGALLFLLHFFAGWVNRRQLGRNTVVASILIWHTTGARRAAADCPMVVQPV